MDWAKKEENVELKKEGGSPQIKIKSLSSDEEDLSENSGKYDSPIYKNLGNMIDIFLPRGFGDFLMDEIKDLRNDITHGEVIESSRVQATICLLSLRALMMKIEQDELSVSEQ